MPDLLLKTQRLFHTQNFYNLGSKLLNGVFNAQFHGRKTHGAAVAVSLKLYINYIVFNIYQFDVAAVFIKKRPDALECFEYFGYGFFLFCFRY